MRKFILSHEVYEGEVELVYNNDGLIKKYSDHADTDATQIEFILRTAPVHVKDFKQWAEKGGFAYTEIKEAPTFELFWSLWPEKKANKKPALKLWKGLSERDKQRIIDVMPAMKRYVQRNPTKFPKYPDSWIRQGLYENDYNSM